MGFSDNHISVAIRTLRIRQDDLSAGTINNCAMWMIDHPESPQQQLNPGPAAYASSSPPLSFRPTGFRRQHTHPRSSTLAQDIRSYFRRHRTSVDQSYDVSSSSEDSSVTLSAGGGGGNVDEAFISGAWGVGVGSSAHPNVVTRGTRRFVERVQARCQFCDFQFSSTVSSAQHMARHHPGCGRQMDDVRCGGLLRDNYVLCSSCMNFYSHTAPAPSPTRTEVAAATSAAGSAAARRRGVLATAARSDTGELKLINACDTDMR